MYRDMESIDSLAKAINNFQGGLMLVSHGMRIVYIYTYRCLYTVDIYVLSIRIF